MDNRLNILDTSIKKKNYDSLWFSLDGGFLEKINKKKTIKRTNIINVKTKIDSSSKTPVNIYVDFYNQQGGELNKISDLSIIIPSNSTPRIQESQRVILHIICEIVEEYFSSKK
jgi:hypothetical protein